MKGESGELHAQTGWGGVGGAFLQPLSQRFQEGNGTSGAAKIKEGDKHLFFFNCLLV